MINPRTNLGLTRGWWRLHNTYRLRNHWNSISKRHGTGKFRMLHTRWCSTPGFLQNIRVMGSVNSLCYYKPDDAPPFSYTHRAPAIKPSISWQKPLSSPLNSTPTRPISDSSQWPKPLLPPVQGPPIGQTSPEDVPRGLVPHPSDLLCHPKQACRAVESRSRRENGGIQTPRGVCCPAQILAPTSAPHRTLSLSLWNRNRSPGTSRGRAWPWPSPHWHSGGGFPAASWEPSRAPNPLRYKLAVSRMPSSEARTCRTRGM